MNCALIHEPNEDQPKGGGGNNRLISANRLIVRRSLAIGDSLCATVVADKLIDLGFEVIWQTHPAVHCVIRRHPRISEVQAPNGYTDVDLDGAYETDPSRRLKHFHTMFYERANNQLSRFGISLGEPKNCRPSIRLPHCDKEAARERWKEYPRPWIGVVPRSETYNVRQVHDGTWAEAAKRMPGTKFWIARHPAPPGFVDLHASHFDHVILWCSVLDLLVTVDTGPMHVASALGTQCLVMNQSSSPALHLSDQADWSDVTPPLDCLNCQQNVCPKNNHMPPCQNIDPDQIAAWARAKLRRLYTEDISAIVAIYQPKVEVLNRCLEMLIPQVQEIVVTCEGRSVIPDGATQGDKIRYVRTGKVGIGYSGNANFGARNTCGKYLLFINDDVFLKPDAVEKMREQMKPGIGIVSNLLRYPDGSIYHSGKVRGPGQKGWGHGNHRQMHPYFSEPTEQENTCGCCILTPRNVFFEAGGFDEEMPMFAQDDAYCLTVRQLGHKIIFTPYSEGTHMEHQSVVKIGPLHEILAHDNAIFGRKWGWYLEKNLNKIPGDF